MILKSLPRLLVCLALSSLPCMATELIGFNPQGFTKGGPSPWTQDAAPGSITLAPGVVLKSGLERGAGIAAGGTAEAWGGGGWAMQEKEAAISEQDYFTFTIAPAENKALSLQGLQAVIFRGTNSATTYLWQYQVGSADFADIGAPVTTSGESVKGTLQDTLDLSKIPALQKITQPVTFRMVGWGATTKGASWGFGKSTGQPVLSVEGSVTP